MGVISVFRLVCEKNILQWLILCLIIVYKGRIIRIIMYFGDING